MTIGELRTLIASGEGATLEVKETTGQRVDACETLCGFLNKDGGTLGGSRSRATENEMQADSRKESVIVSTRLLGHATSHGRQLCGKVGICAEQPCA